MARCGGERQSPLGRAARDSVAVDALAGRQPCQLTPMCDGGSRILPVRLSPLLPEDPCEALTTDEVPRYYAEHHTGVPQVAQLVAIEATARGVAGQRRTDDGTADVSRGEQHLADRPSRD